MEFEFQTDRDNYVNLRQRYVALKLKFVKDRDYKTYKTKDVTKEHREEAKADEEVAQEEDQEAPVPLLVHVYSKLHSIFSNVEVYINNQRFYISKGLYANKFYISNIFKGIKGVLHSKGYQYGEFPGETMETRLFELFFTRRMKMLSMARSMASCCMVNWLFGFSLPLNCYIQIWKLGYE